MPTLADILRQLQVISYETALLGLFITAGTIVITRDWRLLILALLAQYILVGLMLSRMVRPDIAVLEVMIGAFICPILFLSARQVSVSPTIVGVSIADDYYPGGSLSRWWKQLALSRLLLGEDQRRFPAPTGTIFRVFVAGLLMLVSVSLSQSMPLPDLMPVAGTAVYWLVLAGLVILMLNEEPIKAGHGLFTILTGFGLYFTNLERSLLLTGLWGAVSLLLALAVGYLTVVRGTGPEDES
jgi:hypothetical protein